MIRGLMLVICWVSGLFVAAAQDSIRTNQQIVTTLAAEFKARPARPTGKLEGEGAAWFLPWAEDSLGVGVQVALPLVKYEKKDSTFIRKVEITVSWTDSIPQGTLLRYSDTLSMLQLRQVLRDSDPEIQGDDPRWRARWFRPAAWVVGSLAFFITLYYLRSPQR